MTPSSPAGMTSEDAPEPAGVRVDLMILPDGRQFLFRASRPDIKIQVPKPKSPDDFLWTRAFEKMRRKMEANA